MTDKNIMVAWWQRIIRELRNAEAGLEIAEKILRKTFVINDSGFHADQISNVSRDISVFRSYASDRVLPAIRKI